MPRLSSFEKEKILPFLEIPGSGFRVLLRVNDLPDGFFRKVFLQQSINLVNLFIVCAVGSVIKNLRSISCLYSRFSASSLRKGNLRKNKSDGTLS